MIRETLTELMLISGLSGHEARVAAAIAAHLDRIGLAHRSDRLGNLMTPIWTSLALSSARSRQTG
jgi:putative aminopeptidase